jgi:hypothetical protein
VVVPLTKLAAPRKKLLSDPQLLEMVILAVVLNGFLLTVALSALLTFLCVAWMTLNLEQHQSHAISDIEATMGQKMV